MQAMDMGSKLKEYIKSLRRLLEEGGDIKSVDAFKKELLAEIQFWQQERLIHLLVVILFAIVTIGVLLVLLFRPELALAAMELLLLALLIPYIWHYFILENGVQTLYVIYEEVCRRYCGETVCSEVIPEQYGVKIEKIADSSSSAVSEKE